jgi:uncharacterized surface protein with fasciclin (FAS1) repeats
MLKNNKIIQYILLGSGGMLLAVFLSFGANYLEKHKASQSTNKISEKEIQLAQQDIVEIKQTPPEHKRKKTLPEVTKETELQKIENLIEEAGLTEELQGKGPFTFFLPNDKVFDNDLYKNSKEEKARLLTYHIVPGKLKIEDFSDGENIKTLEGGIISFTEKNGNYKINDTVNVTKTNIEIENGYIHIIDGILKPEEDN